MVDRMTIHSYRRVFRIDRRIYRIDRWTLPVPGGIPLVGVAYFAVAFVAVLLLKSVPVVSDTLGLLHPLLSHVFLPLILAVLAMNVEPDGRPTYRFAADWLRFRFRKRRKIHERHVPTEGEAVQWKGKVRTLWDMDSPVQRKARVKGPARIEFRDGATLGLTSRGRWIARAGGSKREYDVKAGETLEVRS
jgi:hypothetical protein